MRKVPESSKNLKLLLIKYQECIYNKQRENCRTKEKIWIVNLAKTLINSEMRNNMIETKSKYEKLPTREKENVDEA